MQCPYCKNEMIKGYIPAVRTAVMWIPDGEKIPATIFSESAGVVKLTDFPIWKCKKAVSYFCEECHVIITPAVRNT